MIQKKDDIKLYSKIPVYIVLPNVTEIEGYTCVPGNGFSKTAVLTYLKSIKSCLNLVPEV